jgi:hypothetical protein
MDAVNLLQYESANLLVANPDKTQFFIAAGEKVIGPIRVGHALIERSDEIELLGMKVKEDLTFSKHIEDVIRALNQRQTLYVALPTTYYTSGRRHLHIKAKVWSCGLWYSSGEGQ